MHCNPTGKSRIILIATIIIVICLSGFESANKSAKATQPNYTNYFLKVYEADSLYIIKDYAKSYAVLDKLFQVYEPLNLEKYKEYETYIACAYALKKPMDFKKIFLKSISLYGTNFRYIKMDSILNSAYKFSKISIEEALQHEQIYRNSLNFDLRDSIKKICEDDQLVRVNPGENNVRMKTMDSINQIKLKTIFDKHGYPHEKLIGEFYIDSTHVNLAAVFLHTNSDFRLNYLLPKILDAIKKGKAYPEIYSESYDRYLTQTDDGKQLYGSYGRTYTLKYPDKVDSLRKSIGLPSTKFNNWRLKAKYGFELP